MSVDPKPQPRPQSADSKPKSEPKKPHASLCLQLEEWVKKAAPYPVQEG